MKVLKEMLQVLGTIQLVARSPPTHLRPEIALREIHITDELAETSRQVRIRYFCKRNEAFTLLCTKIVHC